MEVFDQNPGRLECLMHTVRAAAGHVKQHEVGLAGIGLYARQRFQTLIKAYPLATYGSSLLPQGLVMLQCKHAGSLTQDIDVVGKTRSEERRVSTGGR